jgi:DNA-binding NarL/FixJ family response regulator
MNRIPLRLMLVDDHAVVREGLRAMLEDGPGLSIVAEVASGDEAVQLAPRVAPDVVLIDLMMPGLSAAQTIACLKQNCPRCRVIVFTSFAEDRMLLETLQAGATGYLLKDASRHDLMNAIRSVAQGDPWLRESMQRQMIELLRRPAPHDPFALLTPRERGVLELVGEGLNNRRIAERLKLTEGTVKGYVSAILDKLDVEDRTQAALYFNRHAVVREVGA